MRELAFRMSLHAASPAAAFNRTHILTLNYRLINTSAEGIDYLDDLESNATSLARLRAAAASWTQRVPIHGRKTLLVYRTNWAVAAAAAAVGVLGVLAVLPLYFGWWELGRAPSLNPLETGVAMGAQLLLQRPALDESYAGGDDDDGGGRIGGQQQQQRQPPPQQRRVNSNGGHAHIEARVGALRVRYCAVPVVDKVDEEKHSRGQDADESAEDDTLRG
jgi:hypothetical protein